MPTNEKARTARISVAECAARTGLSARALRVYEQRGLIKPVRNAKGWRQYSSADLSRLNTIVVLKSMGFSLGAIRRQLTTSAVSLEEILRMQMDAWKARKLIADQAIALVEGALTHVKSRRSVPIDHLCALVRHFEMNNSVPRFKQLVEQHITQDDSDAWASWWTDHPDDLAESTRYQEAQKEIFQELKAAMDSGANPDSGRAKILMSRWESLFSVYHVRERAIRQMRWNYDVTFKWFMVGHKNRVHEIDPNEDIAKRGFYTPKFASFLTAAFMSSDHGKAIGAVHESAFRQLTSGVDPSSYAASRTAARFRRLCTTFDLGDALTYVQFALFIERINHSSARTRKAKIWDFLQRALEEHFTDTRPSIENHLQFGLHIEQQVL